MEKIQNTMRLDIQGLRALAVLSVVIFHISPYHLHGGFVGVDIFFVISGYLIMGHIWRSLNDQNFSLTEFYIKRFKRLLPALLLVLFISSIAAYFLLLPSEYRSYTKSVFSSLFYVSNFWFYSKSDYFDAELLTSPLLHTWSLSVEEQFYLITPLLLLFLYKRFKSTTTTIVILIVLALLTLWLSQWMITNDQSLSFYASPTRFWQFIAGGMISISGVAAPKKTYSQLLTFVGLILLIVTFFIYSDQTPFPGLMAVPVTLATAVIIYARCETGPIGFLLTNPLSNFFGNISYSLYLWHWPIIIFYKSVVLDNFEKLDKLIVLLFSILLAFLTYKFVEEPFRRMKIKRNSIKPVFISVSLTCLFAVVVYSTTGLQRLGFTESEIYFDEYQSYHNPSSRLGDCFLTSNFNDFSYFNQHECITAVPHKFNILLIGDSHAEHWYSALAQNLGTNETLSQVTSSGCLPIIPYEGEKRCTDLVKWSYKWLILEHRFDKIILSGRWHEKDIKRLPETIKLLGNYTDQIEILGPVIEYRYSLPWLLAKFYRTENIMGFSNYNARLRIDKELERVVKNLGVSYVSVINLMCEDNLTCKYTTEQGIPIQFDYGHLTHDGAAYLVAKF